MATQNPGSLMLTLKPRIDFFLCKLFATGVPVYSKIRIFLSKWSEYSYTIERCTNAVYCSFNTVLYPVGRNTRSICGVK